MKIVRSAKLIVLDEKNDVLILRRSETHPWAALMPDLPGGIIEETEDFEAGVLRELYEETGLRVEQESLHLLYNVEAYETHEMSVKRLIYGTRIAGIKPQVNISWEHDKFEWIPISNIEKLENVNQTALQAIIDQKLWQAL